MTTINLADFEHDPFVNQLLQVELLIASWSAEVRETVAVTLDDLALLCVTRADPAQRQAGLLLAETRRLIRALEAHFEQPPTRSSADRKEA